MGRERYEGANGLNILKSKNASSDPSPQNPLALMSHSDSLDTLLYVRFAIQNLEFYEWKLGDRQWALS